MKRQRGLDDRAEQQDYRRPLLTTALPAASGGALSNLRFLDVRGRDGPVQKEVQRCPSLRSEAEEAVCWRTKETAVIVAVMSGLKDQLRIPSLQVLIVWDVENTQIPPGATVEDVEKAIGNAFQYLQRWKRVAFICALSPGSLDTMTRMYGREQVSYLTKHADVRLAPGGSKSRSTDTKLIQSIEEFINRQSQEGKAANSVLVVITGDDDYTESIRRAMDVGMDVEVLHPGGKTSRNLLTAIRGRANVWHHDWHEFVEYWLWANHGVKLPPLFADVDGGYGCAAWAGQRDHHHHDHQPHLQQPQRQPPPPPPRPPQREQQGAGVGSPPQKQKQDAVAGRGKARKRFANSLEGGVGAAFGRVDGSGSSVMSVGADSGGGAAAGVAQGGADAAAVDAVRIEAGGSAAFAAGAAGHGADAKPAAAERVRARLRLDSLPAIRESDAPTRLLSGACTWFLEERRLRSDFFQRLPAIASEAGCKLRVGEDPQSVGEVEVECVDGDEPNPERAVQNALDELARAINDRLAQAIEDRGPMFGFQPPPPPPPPRTPKPHSYGSPGVTPCGRATPEQLAEFLRKRGVDTTGGGGGGDGNGGVQGQLRAMVNAILVVEAALGLPNIPLSDGSLLVAATGWEIGTTCPEQKRAAARDVLARRMSNSQLLAAARAREVAIAAGMEKRCVAEMLAEEVLQEACWDSVGSGSSRAKG